MSRFLWVPLTCVAVSSACAAHQPPFDFEHRIALVTSEKGRVCAGGDDVAFAPGTRVQVIDVLERRSLSATVKSPLASCKVDAAIVTPGRELEMETPVATQVMGMAIAASSVTVKVADASISADIDGDGRPEFFRSCTSYEGVHLTVWTDAPLTGIRRWHVYHYLGYDTEPSCTTAEVWVR